MKRLNENEIRFIKETNCTPQVLMGDEWKRTPFINYRDAVEVARERYDVDLDEMCDKFGDSDSISLEYTATYLIYTFFSKAEIENASPKYMLKWLQDFKYHCGFRKWSEDFVAIAMDEALDIYAGVREFYLEDDEMWNRAI